MLKILINNKLLLIAFVLSMLFLVINIVTLDWYPLPWIDEVAFADTPINVALYGKWDTTVMSYYYSPLYAFLLIPWIWIFGVSHSVVTSFSIVIAFFLCLLLSRYLINSKKITSAWSLIIFILMFWGASVLSWNFRCGRVDVLIMFFTFLVVGEILQFKTFQSKNYIRLLLFSFLLFLSGIPSIPFVLYLLLILFISQSHYRKIIFKQGLIFVVSCLLGFFLVSFFYWIHDYILNYWRSFYTFNATIVGTRTILDRLTEAYNFNREALILSAVNLSVFSLFFFRKLTLDSITVLFLFSCLFVPLIMTLAGRYRLYYSWLFFIPTLIITIILLDGSSKYIKVLISLVAIFLFVTGFPNSLSKGNRGAISRINEFITNQPITSNSSVAADYVPYYAIKNITKRCYFLGTYSIIADSTDLRVKSPKDYGSEFLNRIIAKQKLLENKTIIVDTIDFIIKSPKSYKSENLDEFITKQKSLGKTITAIDSMNNPKIIVYQVK